MFDFTKVDKKGLDTCLFISKIEDYLLTSPHTLLRSFLSPCFLFFVG